MSRTELRRILLFLGIAYGLSWAVWLLPPLAAWRGVGIYGPAIAGLVVSFRRGERDRTALSPRLAIFGAALLIGAVVFYASARASGGRPALRWPWLAAVPALVPAWILSTALSRNGGVRRYAAPLLAPTPWALVAVGSFALYLVLPAAGARLAGLAPVPATTPLTSGAAWGRLGLALLFVFLYGGGVSEEPGWRGFLLPALLRRSSPLAASVVVWMVWATWHAPLDAGGYLGPTLGAYLMNRVVLLLPLSVLLTWLYLRSDGSVLTAAAFHTSFNALPAFFPSVNGAWVLLYVWAAVVIVTDRMWATSPAPAAAVPPSDRDLARPSARG